MEPAVAAGFSQPSCIACAALPASVLLPGAARLHDRIVALRDDAVGDSRAHAFHLREQGMDELVEQFLFAVDGAENFVLSNHRPANVVGHRTEHFNDA